MSDKYLKPCPFCGSPATIRKIKKVELAIDEKINEKVPEDLLIVGCVGDDCIVRVGRLIFTVDSEESAVERWNRRVNDE